MRAFGWAATIEERPARWPELGQGDDNTIRMHFALRTGAAVALALMWAVSAAPAGDVTLGAAAATSGRYFGAALDPDALDEKLYRDLAAAELTSVTPENAA